MYVQTVELILEAVLCGQIVKLVNLFLLNKVTKAILSISQIKYLIVSLKGCCSSCDLTSCCCPLFFSHHMKLPFERNVMNESLNLL